MRHDAGGSNVDPPRVDWEQMRRLRRAVRFPAPLHAADGKAVSPQLLKQVFDIIADHAGAGSWRMTYTDIAREANIVRTDDDRADQKTRHLKRAVSVLKRIGVIAVTRTRWGNEYQVHWSRVREFCELESAPGTEKCPEDTLRSVPEGTLESVLRHPTSTSLSKRPQSKESTLPQSAGGLFKIFSWGRTLTANELRTPKSLQSLYRQAVDGGLLTRDAEQDRVSFFAFARYCTRTATKNAAGLFNRGLRKPDKFGKGWRQKPSAADEDWARDAIRYMDTGQRPRDQYQAVLRAKADADDATEHDKRRQLAKLTRQFQQQGVSR